MLWYLFPFVVCALTRIACDSSPQCRDHVFVAEDHSQSFHSLKKFKPDKTDQFLRNPLSTEVFNPLSATTTRKKSWTTITVYIHRSSIHSTNTPYQCRRHSLPYPLLTRVSPRELVLYPSMSPINTDREKDNSQVKVSL